VKWTYSQSLLAALYVIVASVCAEKGIATDVGAVEKDSVDVRIVLVDHTKGRNYSPEQLIDSEERGNGTTVPDLVAFSRRKQSWKTVFHPSSEEGYGLLGEFLKLAEGKMKILQDQIIAVDCGIMLTTGQEVHDDGHSDKTGSITKPYDSVCLGGTFDHLHVGHKLLLHATALLVADAPEQTSELIVGISGDALLVKKAYAEELQPWTSRARSVISFLETVIDLKASAARYPETDSTPAPKDNEEFRAHLRDGRLLVRCVNIPDPFGPTITEEGIRAIVVSAETRSGGAAINKRRGDKGWGPLEVYEIDVLDAGGVEPENGETGKESFESKISSTTIRKQRMEARATQGA
jgi:phosphopantetheine adenylyltransferase